MFEGIIKLFKKIGRKEREEISSKETAKERLHLVLMQDRANVSADFLEMMKQEIIEVIKKYIDVDEKDIDVRLTNKTNEDGTTGAPALYANIPIAGIKQDVAANEKKEEEIKIDNVPEVIIEEANENIELDDKEEEKGQEEKEVVVESETKPEEAKEIVEETKENKEPEKVEEEKKASNVAKKPSTAKKNTAKTSTNKTTKNGKKTTNTNKPKAKKSK